MSMNFSGSVSKPLAAALSSPVPPPPPDPTPAKPLAPEEGPSLVASSHAPGVLYEPSARLTPDSTYAVGPASDITGAGTAAAPLSPPERPALSRVQQEAASVYGRIASFAL